MKSIRFTILLYGAVLLVLLAPHIEAKPNFRKAAEQAWNGFQNFMSTFDMLSIQEEVKEDRRVDLLNALEVFESEARGLLNDLKTKIYSAIGKTIESIKKRRQENKQELIDEWRKLQATVSTLVHESEDNFGQLHTQFETSLKNVGKLIGDSHKTFQEKLKAVPQEVEPLTKAFNAELKTIKRSFDKLFQSVEKHGGIAHRPHVKLISCGGKMYTLQEFLDLFDEPHNLLILEEDTWTDQELEEFYEGWDVWAKKMGLKCEGGASDWKSIAIPKEDL